MATPWPFMTALLSPAPNVSRRKSSSYNYLPRGKNSRHRSLPSNAIAKHNDDVLSSYSSSSKPQGRARVAFPGGGLFFYWQAGVIVSFNNYYISSPEHPSFSCNYSRTKLTNVVFFNTHYTHTHILQAYLQEEGYNLSSHNTLVSGASAGALSATLAKTGVNPYDATTLALSMSEDAGIWDRPSGLQGVWGNIIRDWLERLLPADAEERAEDGVRSIALPVSIKFIIHHELISIHFM
jgi:hypothetical protein